MPRNQSKHKKGLLLSPAFLLIAILVLYQILKPNPKDSPNSNPNPAYRLHLAFSPDIPDPNHATVNYPPTYSLELPEKVARELHAIIKDHQTNHEPDSTNGILLEKFENGAWRQVHPKRKIK